VAFGRTANRGRESGAIAAVGLIGQSAGAHTDSKRPLLAYLKGDLASLMPTERLIAECVQADPENVITSAMAEIGQQSGASVGPIVPLCRRLGPKGFEDFKSALAGGMAQSGRSVADATGPNRRPARRFGAEARGQDGRAPSAISREVAQKAIAHRLGPAPRELSAGVD
jgi:DNA-binding MurR/RpiR family transcriptional regulator